MHLGFQRKIILSDKPVRPAFKKIGKFDKIFVMIGWTRTYAGVLFDDERSTCLLKSCFKSRAARRPTERLWWMSHIAENLSTSSKQLTPVEWKKNLWRAIFKYDGGLDQQFCWRKKWWCEFSEVEGQSRESNLNRSSTSSLDSFNEGSLLMSWRRPAAPMRMREMLAFSSGMWRNSRLK